MGFREEINEPSNIVQPGSSALPVHTSEVVHKMVPELIATYHQN